LRRSPPPTVLRDERAGLEAILRLGTANWFSIPNLQRRDTMARRAAGRSVDHEPWGTLVSADEEV
jgi:hypothetical protein